MGSVSDSVARHAHCPVLVVRPSDGDGLIGGRILLGIDGSEEASLATEAAAEMLRPRTRSCT
jgi:nucleotide-binding universal stress UspA family protein